MTAEGWAAIFCGRIDVKSISSRRHLCAVRFLAIHLGETLEDAGETAVWEAWRALAPSGVEIVAVRIETVDLEENVA